MKCPLCAENTDPVHDVPRAQLLTAVEAEERIKIEKAKTQKDAEEAEFRERFADKIHPPYVIAYRIGEFLGMGFDQDAADRLANTRHDVHMTRRMVQQGCPHPTALEILL